MPAHDIPEGKVIQVGSQTVIHVANGRGEELRQHLLAHNIDAEVSPGAETAFERLEILGDEDPALLQDIVDEWEQ